MNLGGGHGGGSSSNANANAQSFNLNLGGGGIGGHGGGFGFPGLSIGSSQAHVRYQFILLDNDYFMFETVQNLRLRVTLKF